MRLSYQGVVRVISLIPFPHILFHHCSPLLMLCFVLYPPFAGLSVFFSISDDILSPKFIS